MTNGQQLNELFLSCGMGFLLGAFYDVFRLIRLIMKPGAKAIFFQDLAYFLISAIVTFLFALAVMDGSCGFICSSVWRWASPPITLPSAA